jgi:hypothetical protein
VATDLDFAERLEIFFGASSDAQARVYARLPGVDTARGARLAGTIVGPECLYGSSLPATLPLVDLGAGDSLLAQVVVPEPCFWNPEMPQLYQAEVRLEVDGESVACARRSFGIRRLGAAGRKLIFDGRRWVLRGVRVEPRTRFDFDAWHAAATAVIVENPNDEFCDQASRQGVLVVAEMATANPAEIRRVSRWPAVGIVVLPCGTTVDLNGLAHNLVFAERFAPHEPLRPACWADVVVCEIGERESPGASVADCRLPILAIRPGVVVGPIAELRAQCDRLQRDLAGQGEFAGYIV